MNPFYEKFNELITVSQPFVQVTVVDTIGSVPQERGAKMLVTKDGLFYGTVGGGKVENRALQEAKQLLENPATEPTRFVQWQLDKDIGMTCGGTMKLFFEVFNAHLWNIVIFGAGHVSQALVPILSKLDCRITCIDPREEWLVQLPDGFIKKICVQNMPDAVAEIEDGSFVLLMTMGHTTDKPILLEILKTREFPYLGVIGSRAKAERLKNDIDEAGLPASAKEKFICPIGLDVGGNHPQEIAISVAAQLLQVRDAMASKKEVSAVYG